MTLGPVQSAPAFSPPTVEQNAPMRLGDTADLTFDISGLDTNGDGKVGDDEFATYRSAKQARGEFIPLDGPASDAMQQAMFEAFLAQDTQDQDA